MLQPVTEALPDPGDAQEELRVGIEQSRELVRQSTFLIALSESEGAPSPDDDPRPAGD